ncbi:MAG TPA: type 1 glutamine amidotransferase domain-containing protein [Hydrogenothermaceae bacterium]|nr:type 1 glutamine amidotransferase domain-containing protein [Hydrogenothermaceae bacterium]
MKFLISFMVMLFVTFAIPASYADNQSKILLVLTSHSKLGSTGEKTGFWLPELTHPYYKFKKAGYLVDVASIQGGTAPIDHKIFDQPDEQESNQRFLQDAELMAKVFKTIPLSKVAPSAYSAIVFVGGSGTMWDFPNNEDVQRVTASIYESNGIVSAICHGPAALVNVKLSNGKYLVSGKKVSAITNEEEKDLKMTKINPFMLQDKLTERGAKHIYGKPWQENVVVDGRLITGQNPASALKVAEKIIEHLKHNRK